MYDKTLYSIVNETDGFIQCRGVFPYYESVGHLMCIMADDDAEKESNGYTLVEQTNFEPLDCDTGYFWEHVFQRKDLEKDKTVETWYLLEVPSDEDETGA